MTPLQLLGSAHAVSLPTELVARAVKHKMIALIVEEGERIADALKAKGCHGYLTRVRRQPSWSPLSFLESWTSNPIRMHDLECRELGGLCLGEDGVVYQLHLGRSFYCTKESLQSYDVDELSKILAAMLELEHA